MTRESPRNTDTYGIPEPEPGQYANFAVGKGRLGI
jgi:hypothetical protein